METDTEPTRTAEIISFGEQRLFHRLKRELTAARLEAALAQANFELGRCTGEQREAAHVRLCETLRAADAELSQWQRDNGNDAA